MGVLTSLIIIGSVNHSTFAIFGIMPFFASRTAAIVKLATAFINQVLVMQSDFYEKAWNENKWNYVVTTSSMK